MAKSEFARGTLYWGGTSSTNVVGVVDVTLDENISEIDVTDTETALGESEFLGGRNTRGISFTHIKDVTEADLTMNSVTSFELEVADAGANTTTYSGSAILLTKSITGNIDDAVKVAYSGRITGAVVEAQA